MKGKLFAIAFVLMLHAFVGCLVVYDELRPGTNAERSEFEMIYGFNPESSELTRDDKKERMNKTWNVIMYGGADEDHRLVLLWPVVKGKAVRLSRHYYCDARGLFGVAV